MFRYAHYIAVLSDSKSKSSFHAFYEDVLELVKNKPDGFELSGKDGKGSPVITPVSVIIGEQGFDEPFSEFSLHLNEAFPTHRFPLRTVVTEKRPYDIIICSTLLSLVHHFQGVIEVTTDGSRNDWKQAIALYEYSSLRKAPAIYFQK